MSRIILSKWLEYCVAATICAIFFGIGVMVPMSLWYELDMIHVDNGRVGKPIEIIAERRIKTTFDGRFVVSISRWDGQRWSAFCSHSDSFQYNPRNSLPVPLTFAWWAGDRCAELVKGTPGRYVINTTVFHNGFMQFFGTRASRESNMFEVSP